MNKLLDVDRAHPGAGGPAAAQAGQGTTLVDARCIPDLQRQQRLLDLYLFVIDACLGGGIADWWRRAVRLPFADAAQGVEQIKELCLQELLYDGGDIAAFCRAYEVLEQEGQLANDERGRYLLDLMRFVRPLVRTEQPAPSIGLGRLFRRKNRRQAAVFSVVIPDDESLAHFTDLCLPTLEHDEALWKLFGERAVTLIVSVSERRRAEVETYLRGRQFDCAIVCQPLPDGLCDGSVREDIRRDWLVGAMQYQHLTEARRLGADFHSINPRAMYAGGYLKEVLRLSRDRPAVLSALMWVNNRGLVDRVLTRNESNGSAAISAVALADLGRDVTAPMDASTFVEGNGSLRGPTAHLRMTWAAREHLEIHTTCHEIVYLSSGAVRAMPQRFFARPAAQMELILGSGAQPYFVTEKDGIVIAEFGHPPGAFGDVSGGYDAIVGPLSLRARSALIEQAVRLPVSPRDGASAADGDAEPGKARRAAFATALEGVRSGPRAHQVLTALSVLHQYEMSDYGPESMAKAIAEGRRLIDLSPTAEPALDAGERAALIRAAMNFDHVDKAIALARGGGAATSFVHEFLGTMMTLRAANVQRARRIRRRSLFRRSFAVLGSIAWGEAFVDKFMNYHVPSLLAEGNLPALARRRKVIHSIVTTETDRKRIVASPAFKRLSQCAEVVFTCFPEKFLEQREREQYPFYHFYGLLDHQSVFLAAALRAELYLLPVDIVLSNRSLANLGRRLDRGAASCAMAGIECEPVPLRKWLDEQPRGSSGEFDLSATDLLDTAIAMPDAYARSLIMNPDNHSFCRHPRELVWPRPDGIAVHSLFMHPVAVSEGLMSRPFSPQYENVDYALLPRLLQGDAVHEVLEDPSEVAVAQFGAPAGREEFLDGGFSLEAFIDAHRYNYAVHRRCFAARQFFPCKDPPYAPSASHDADVALIQAALKRYRFTLSGEAGG